LQSSWDVYPVPSDIARLVDWTKQFIINTYTSLQRA
jgi:hypothetical protein